MFYYRLTTTINDEVDNMITWEFLCATYTYDVIVSQRNCAKYEEVRRQFDLRSHEVGLCRQRLQQGSHFQLQEDVNALQATIGEHNITVKKSSWLS